MSNSALSFTVAASGGTGYPTGVHFVVIDRGLSTEEKIKCASRSGDTFTVVASPTGRGADDTSATTHASGAVVEHCTTAIDADEANNWVNQLSTATTAKGDEAIASAANTLSKLAVGANGTVRVADSTQATGQKWVSLSGDGTLAVSGALTLANSGVSASTYGDATHSAQVAIDAKGRVTSASSVTITGTAPGGAASGDLTGTYPSPTIGAGKVTNAAYGGTLGTLGYAEVTANQGSITTITDLTSLTATVTVAAGRRVRITGAVRYDGTVPLTAGLAIYESTTLLQYAAAWVGESGKPVSVVVRAILQPSAGSHTYKLRGERTSASGTATMTAAAGNPGFIHVEDVGT